MNENFELPPKETEYMEYLNTPKTTVEIMERFSAKENACWQILRTLRLKQLVHRVQNGVASHWKITEHGDNAPSIPVTPLQRKYLEYLRSSHSTRDMMEKFDKNETSVQQVTRTLRLMGYVESIGHGSQTGRGGFWVPCVVAVVSAIVIRALTYLIGEYMLRICCPEYSVNGQSTRCYQAA